MVMKFTHELSLMEIEKLTSEELLAYAKYNDNLTGFTKSYEEGRGDQSDIYKEVDEDYKKEADAYLQELNARIEKNKSQLDKDIDRAYEAHEATTKEYSLQATAEANREDIAKEEGQSVPLVKESMSKLIRYTECQDEEIKGLRKEVSEVAGLKTEVADLRKELAEAKELEKERLQKEAANTGNRVFLNKEHPSWITREEQDAIDKELSH